MSEPKAADWDIEWVPRSGGRKPEVPPDPRWPNGKAIDMSAPELPRCRGDLPLAVWPARGLGLLIITCRRCGMSTGVTTAGRPDDPISLTQNCGG